MMKLAIDANAIFSATISDGLTRRLLLLKKFELFAPEFLFEELNKYADHIAKKSNNSVGEVKAIIKELFEVAEIRVFATPELSEFVGKSKDICPDPNDEDYFALALKLDCAIWSNDKELKCHESVRVYTTKELAEEFGLI